MIWMLLPVYKFNIEGVLYFRSDGTLAARRFATYIKDKWSFQKCDNDIVIFISRDDRKVTLMMGCKFQVVVFYNDNFLFKTCNSLASRMKILKIPKG